MVKKHRETKETDISVELEIYGSGKCEIDTGVGEVIEVIEFMKKNYKELFN